jgi:hypothetical protein
MKISRYYHNIGDEVGFHIKDPDQVWISCLYRENRGQAYGIVLMYPDADVRLGGPGLNYGFLPSEIENCPPDYDLYPSEYSQGYTTRSCIRNCPWCIVREKEGNYTRFQHVKIFHDRRFDTVMVMDNNWLADKKWFLENTKYILGEDLKVIEHGMDIRLLDREIAERLSEMRWAKPIKFAYDQPKMGEDVRRGLLLLEDVGIDIRRNVMVYVLAGYNTTEEEDIVRCEELKEWGTQSFVMPYKKTPLINDLARWSNRPWIFWKTSFEKYRSGV